jgi:hypothetical protein
VPGLDALLLGDSPEVWAGLGFALDGAECLVGGVRHCLGGAGEGVLAWSLPEIDGLPRFDPPAPGASRAPSEHPNGVVGLDHLVVVTPDLGRTIDALEAHGIDLRRHHKHQAFFKLGDVVLEVVTSPEVPAGPARFWGLAFTAADLDATAAYLGPRLLPAKDAVQPGRRIATLHQDAGSSIPIAFMTPKTSAPR